MDIPRSVILGTSYPPAKLIKQGLLKPLLQERKHIK